MDCLLKVNYHHQLITMMTRSTLSASLASNIIAPILMVILVYQSIPLVYIYFWLGINLLFFLLRLRINHKLSQAVKEKKDKHINFFLCAVYATIFMSALLYSYNVWYLSLLVNDLSLFTVVFITSVLVSGSMATINSVYHAFAIFVIFNLLPIIFVFIYHGGVYFNIAAFTVSTFLFVMLKSGYRHFISLEENIELKENFEKRVDEAIKELREKDKLLMQQSCLAQMGEMMSMIAHQWRQPLSAISSISSVIQIKTEIDTLDANVAKEMSEKIISITKHLSETIDDFRDFFKPNKLKTETSFDEIFDSVMILLEASLKSTNTIVITDLNDNEKFESYANELKQVLLNLLNNAQDAFLELNLKNPQITVKTYRDKKYRYLTVQDNAGGIQAEHLDLVFDPYFSTKEKKDGAGLGLYMSKLIVEEHSNGILSVCNCKEGAEFSIALPLSEDL